MLELIKKDIIPNRKIILMFFLFPMLLLFYLFSAGRGYEIIPFMITLYAFLLPISIVIREEKMKVEHVICSLPVSRSNVITAKYISSWLIILVFTSVVLIFFELVMSLFQLPGAEGGVNLTFFIVLKGFYLVNFLFILFYPVVLRYGTRNGILIFGVALNLGIVVILVFPFLKSGFKDVLDYLVEASGSYDRLYASFRESDSALFFYLLIIGIIIVLNVLSSAFAKYLYKRKEIRA